MTPKANTAWQLAAHHHANQKYGDHLPYLFHLGQVLLNALTIAEADPALDKELLTCCAILHDLLEDTEADPSEVEQTFGPAVLNGIQALSKNENLPTKQEQMQDSLLRIKAQPREVAVVKICDRISNLSSAPPSWWDTAKVSAYVAEARLILEVLGSASSEAAHLLESAITAYELAYERS